MFPFNYKGTQHNTCITHGDGEGVTPWCYIDTDGTWGNCRADCPGNLVSQSIILLYYLLLF